MAERIILRIELTPKAKEHLEQLSDRQGMTQVAMLSRVIEWYAHQPEIIQRIIVGHLPPEIEQDVARLVLRQLAKPGKRTSIRPAAITFTEISTGLRRETAFPQSRLDDAFFSRIHSTHAARPHPRTRSSRRKRRIWASRTWRN